MFRHTMATLMLEGGADTRFIQAMLGHADLKTTQIYTHVAIRQLQEIHRATHPAKLARASRRRAGQGSSRGARGRMIEYMAVLHITEAELARDVHAVLEKVREGAEVVIEQDHRPVAVIKLLRRKDGISPKRLRRWRRAALTRPWTMSSPKTSRISSIVTASP